MRVGFRTNIEKELVDELKKSAITLGLNANDILEELLFKHFFPSEEDFNMDLNLNVEEFKTQKREHQVSTLNNNLIMNAYNYLYAQGVDLTDEQEKVIAYLSNVIAKFVCDDLHFVEKK